MAKNVDIIQLTQEFEEKIRQGRFFELRQKLSTLSAKNLPREDFATFANFARRIGAPVWALKLLRPIVRMEPEMQRLHLAATGSEIASYALALAASGALFEAQQLTVGIEHLETPQTLQACAYVSVWNWDYRRAIPFFKRYLALAQLSHFQTTLAQINLARSHAFLGHWAKVNELLDVILPAAKKMNWNLVERDALLVRAEANIREEQWTNADRALKAATHISERAGFDGLDVAKWQAILALSQKPTESNFKNLVLPLQATARREHRWEIARDLDFMSGKILQKPALLNHVYFGTPFLFFRKRLLQECREFWHPSAEYKWSPQGNVGDLTLDLTSGKILGGNLPTLSPSLSLNFIRLLSSDFYRPFKRGCILEEIYPHQHYDVKNMAHNLSNVMSLVRKTVEQHQLPMEIEYQKSCYRLNLTKPMSFLIQDPARQPYDSLLQQQKMVKEQLLLLRQKWPYQSFTAQQAAAFLSMPVQDVRKLIRNPLAEKQLFQMGETKSRSYRFQGRKKLKAPLKAA